MIRFADTYIDVSVVVATALATFASKDATRPHIGVGVDKGNLAATDGHRLVVFTDGAASELHGVDYRLCLQGKVWPRAHVETLVKVARAQKADSIRLELDKAGSGFPPAWQVVPSYGMETGRDSIGVSPDYLADLCKVAKACGTSKVEISQAKGELDPIGFAVHGSEHSARVVIMPVRK